MLAQRATMDFEMLRLASLSRIFALKTAEHSLLIHNLENIENKKIIATLNYTV